MSHPFIVVSPFANPGRVVWTLGQPPVLKLDAEPVAAYRQLLVHAPTAVLPGAWPFGQGRGGTCSTGLLPVEQVARHIAETAGARIRADRSAEHLHHEARVLLADLAKGGVL